MTSAAGHERRRTITGQNYTTGYTYESAGRLSSITYASSGWLISYGRDSAGQISYVSATQPSHSPVNLASYVKHMPFGPASSWTYGNGVTDTRTYDLDYRMTSVRDTGTGDIQYLSYSWNAFNNVTGITDHVNAAKNQSFTYDRTGQITFASGGYGAGSVTYNSNSSRLTAAGLTYTIPGTSNRVKKLALANILYTSSGNITSIGLDVSTYNKANQMALVAISGGVTSGYNYDAFGQRLELKTNTSPFQVQIYDLSGHMLTETSQAATPVETDYAYMDDMPLSAIQPGAATISALHTDNIGTVQKATDASKTLVWACAYNAFGACTPSPGSIIQSLRLPGMINDATGLYHWGFRDYNKTLGQGMEADPLGIMPWLLILPSASVNPYPYAANNPITNLDPLGLWQLTVTVAKGGAALRVTTGINNGQPNVGYQFGVGAGWSIAFDPNKSENVPPHGEVGLIGEGRIGRGVGVDISDYISNLNSELIFSAGVPGTKHTSFSIGVKDGQLEEPNVSFTWGESAFFGIGPTIYQPNLVNIATDPCKISGSY